MNDNTVDSRLSYIDNEMLVLDSATQEIDRQAAILDRRIRYTYVYFLNIKLKSEWSYYFLAYILK